MKLISCLFQLLGATVNENIQLSVGTNKE